MGEEEGRAHRRDAGEILARALGTAPQPEAPAGAGVPRDDDAGAVPPGAGPRSSEDGQG